ncbi:MAG: hypothetical protein QXR81_02350 [Candidatus Nezhaarchaeales archaeon]
MAALHRPKPTGIGRALADKLLSRFKTVKDLFTAKEAGLEAVIGSAKVRRIISVINAPYREGRGSKLNWFKQGVAVRWLPSYNHSFVL